MNSEEWRDISDYVGYYMISNYGRVQSLIQYNGHKYVKRKTPYILNQSNTTTGYKKIELYKKGKRKSLKVHRLVAHAFILNPLGKSTVNHLDHNPINNHVDNLEWTTTAENIRHSCIFRSRRIIPIIDEQKIIMMYKQRRKIVDIANDYKCSVGTIYYLLKRNGIERRTYSESRDKYGIDLEIFKEYVDKGLSNKEIKKMFNCSSDLVATRKYQYKKGKI